MTNKDTTEQAKKKEKKKKKEHNNILKLLDIYFLYNKSRYHILYMIFLLRRENIRLVFSIIN